MRYTGHIFWLLLAVSAVNPACDRQSKDIVTGHGNTLVKSRSDAVQAADKSELAVIQGSINSYHAANGAYPATIQAVGSLLGSQIDYAKYDYNPQTGVISLKSGN